VKVTTTTVVDDGKDEPQPVAKAWDGETIATRVLKSEDERRFTLNVIYPADKADAQIAMDGHRDFASKAAVEDAAWNYMRNYREVGLFHSAEHAAASGAPGAYQGSGSADLVESYIYRGPDWTVKAADDSEVVVKAGDWLGGFVWTPQAWKHIKAGTVGGVSVEGGAKRRRPSPQAVAGLRS
jgi:hypothetical protein